MACLGVSPVGAVGLDAAAAKPVAKKATKAIKAKPASAKVPTTKAPVKQTSATESDSSAGRDKFCAALLASRAQVVKNFNDSNGTTAQEVIAAQSKLNRQTQIALADQAHLTILKFAALSSAAAYEVIGSEAEMRSKLDNVIAELVATLRAIATNAEFNGIETLQAYAVSRCNFSMFVTDLENLDAAPDDVEVAKLLADVDADAAEIAKVQFPPAPPKSATWPRKDRYIGVAKPVTIPNLFP
jgi:hypothetical protein